MYLDLKRNRLLLRNGVSIVTPEHMASVVMETGEAPDHLWIEKGPDSEAYATIHGIDIGYVLTDEDEIGGPAPEEHIPVNQDDIIDIISQSQRYNPNDASDKRIMEELRFFEESGNLVMLKRCHDLIQRLLSDGVVVGVGRGSACASYVLYLLGIHDVDPIKYGIPFVELSKESKRDFETDEQ